MAASVSAIYNMLLRVDETLGLAEIHADDPTLTHEVGSGAATLNGVIDADTSPAVTKVFSGVVTVAGGVTTLDLTSLTGPEGTIDFTGLKPQLVLIAAFLGNIGPIAIKSKDSTTGYNLFGTDNTGSEEYSLLIGQTALFRLNDKGEDVDSTHKDITFTGNNGNTAHIIMVAG